MKRPKLKALKTKDLMLRSLIISFVIYGVYYAVNAAHIKYPDNYLIVGMASFVLFTMLFLPQLMGVKKERFEPDINFIFMLAHMLSVATSKTSNVNVVGSVSRSDLYGKYSKLFRKVYLLVKEYGYDFPRAMLIVSKAAEKIKYLKDFMERYAAAVRVGEDIERFMEVELRNSMNTYEYIYSRIMDSTRVLLGVYTAVMTSVIFVISNLLVLSIIFGGNYSLIYMSFIGSFFSLVAVLATLKLGLPKDFLVIEGPVRKKVIQLPYIAMLIGVAAALWIFIMYVFYIININVFLLIAIMGGMLLGSGYLFRKIEGFVRHVDEDFPVFIRMYGSNLSIVPSPLKAIEPLTSVVFGYIASAIRRLHTLLSNNISFSVAIKEFARTSASELIRRSSEIVSDTLKYGGNTVKVGLILSDLSQMVNRIRRRRLQVHKTFETSVYALHTTNILLITFITSLMTIFAKALSSIQTMIPFYAMPQSVITMLSVSTAISLTIINSVALTLTNGGLKHTLIYYMGLLLLLGGISAYMSGILVDYIMKPLSSIMTQTLQPVYPANTTT